MIGKRRQKQRRAVLCLAAAMICGMVFCTLFCSTADARPHLFGRSMRTAGRVVASIPAGIAAGETATAQGVANIMARIGRVGHFGGNPGYEGCGMASTKEQAYNICCYSRSGMGTVDVGYAQGANGMWFCCRRYDGRAVNPRP